MKCQKSRVFEQVRNRGFQTKAQGMPVNVIIIAVVALIVLVVLIAIFTGRLGIFTKTLDACPGGCMSLSDCKSPDVIMRQYKDCSSTISETSGGGIRISAGEDVCCVKLSK